MEGVQANNHRNHKEPELRQIVQFISWLPGLPSYSQHIDFRRIISSLVQSLNSGLECAREGRNVQLFANYFANDDDIYLVDIMVQEP